MNNSQEEQKSESASRNCPACRHGDKSFEAHRARHDHYLSYGRVHGTEKLRQHLIEQHGEERYNFSYSHVPGMIDRALTIEAWREEDLLSRKKISAAGEGRRE